VCEIVVHFSCYLVSFGDNRGVISGCIINHLVLVFEVVG
jgi:hypothetical protein